MVEEFARVVDLMIGAAVVLGAGDAMAVVEGHGETRFPKRDALSRASLGLAHHLRALGSSLNGCVDWRFYPPMVFSLTRSRQNNANLK